ncbi:FAD-dependent oxidoreductase [Streptomyces sp. NPDC057963]|uniref:FAD-dependent oxidoreductase n=1 Tax=Streptomyces sp. NPDC057963 TaxID=3346290 RepID=UPI0036E89582
MEATTNTQNGGVVPAADEVYDVVVIGAGAAGPSAALVPGRARRRVAVVDAGGRCGSLSPQAPQHFPRPAPQVTRSD